MVQRSPTSSHLIVLGTGGTIAGRAASPADNLGYTAAQVSVDTLVRALQLPPTVQVSSEQLTQIDSKDMDFPVWQALARRCRELLERHDVIGLVITHGTDTLEETAFFLQSVLSPTKPVVLTCAMRPASALVPDGPQNLRDAIAAAGTPGAHGVSVVCAGVIHSALDVQKVHTYRLDAFGSGDAGPLGYVEEGTVRLLRAWPRTDDSAATSALQEVLKTPPDHWPRVEIVTSHAGARGQLIDALLQERRQNGVDAVQGLVLAATGNGTLHSSLEAAAFRAQAEGVWLLRATRCAEGHILGATDAALPSAGGLTPVKARIALLLSLLRQGR